MRARRRDTEDQPLSIYADDWVSARERGLLGDREANRLAFDRRREEALHRPPVVIDYAADVTGERPSAAEPTPEDTAALDVLAWREAVLAGDLLPWMTKGATR